MDIMVDGDMMEGDMMEEDIVMEEEAEIIQEVIPLAAGEKHIRTSVILLFFMLIMNLTAFGQSQDQWIMGMVTAISDNGFHVMDNSGKSINIVVSHETKFIPFGNASGNQGNFSDLTQNDLVTIMVTSRGGNIIALQVGFLHQGEQIDSSWQSQMQKNNQYNQNGPDQNPQFNPYNNQYNQNNPQFNHDNQYNQNNPQFNPYNNQYSQNNPQFNPYNQYNQNNPQFNPYNQYNQNNPQFNPYNQYSQNNPQVSPYNQYNPNNLPEYNQDYDPDCPECNQNSQYNQKVPDQNPQLNHNNQYNQNNPQFNPYNQNNEAVPRFNSDNQFNPYGPNSNHQANPYNSSTGTPKFNLLSDYIKNNSTMSDPSGVFFCELPSGWKAHGGRIYIKETSDAFALCTVGIAPLKEKDMLSFAKYNESNYDKLGKEMKNEYKKRDIKSLKISNKDAASLSFSYRGNDGNYYYVEEYYITGNNAIVTIHLETDSEKKDFSSDFKKIIENFQVK
jgi:hypothetical protein